MAVYFLEVGENYAICYDADTSEKGHLAKMTNGTGSTSVKGTLVAASTTMSAAVMIPATGYDIIGVIYESGVLANSPVWVWLPGSYCRALLVDSVGMSRGQRLAASTSTLGRMTTSTSDSDHLRIGFSLQVQSGGTDVLGLFAFI